MDNSQTRAAIACLKRMVTLQPENVSGWQNLAVAQFMRGLFDDGLASCLEVLECDPANRMTLFNLAVACERIGRYDEGLDWVEQALHLSPRDLTFQKLQFRLRVLKAINRVRSWFGASRENS